jgi:hypothetical protein
MVYAVLALGKDATGRSLAAVAGANTKGEVRRYARGPAPRRGATHQPRAKPWVSRRLIGDALKGRPFRTPYVPDAPETQGFALGW